MRGPAVTVSSTICSVSGFRPWLCSAFAFALFITFTIGVAERLGVCSRIVSASDTLRPLTKDATTATLRGL